MFKRISPWIGFSLSVVCLWVEAAPAQEATQPLPRLERRAEGVRFELLKQLDEQLQAFIDEKQISGVVGLAAKDGKVFYLSALGQADIERHRPMREDTIFAIASMTKPITATAIIILRDEGKLSLDDPVSKFIPEFKDAKLEGKPLDNEITLRHVLTHTSGLSGSQQNEGSLANTAKELAARPLAFAPGDKWEYSPGLTVCGRVVEVVSGQPFEVFLKERIFQPLGMKDTTFHPDAKQQERLATLYKPGAEKDALAPAKHWINDLSGERTPNPSGGLFSTASDMATFYQAILNGGELNGKRIVSADSVREMTTLQTGELTTGFTPGNGWGLGWCVVREPQGVSQMLSKGSFGHGGAFGTQGWVDPQQRMIFVLMIQRTEFGNSDASELRKTLQDLTVQAVQPEN
jgi:CubicO group peptidase (beta-lactamase class C family)